MRRRQPKEAAPAAAAGAGRSPGGAAAALRRRLRGPAALRRCGGARSCLQISEPCRDAPRRRCPVPGQPAAPCGAPHAPPPAARRAGGGGRSRGSPGRLPQVSERGAGLRLFHQGGAGEPPTCPPSTRRNCGRDTATGQEKGGGEAALDVEVTYRLYKDPCNLSPRLYPLR